MRDGGRRAGRVEIKTAPAWWLACMRTSYNEEWGQERGGHQPPVAFSVTPFLSRPPRRVAVAAAEEVPWASGSASIYIFICSEQSFLLYNNSMYDNIHAAIFVHEHLRGGSTSQRNNIPVFFPAWLYSPVRDCTSQQIHRNRFGRPCFRPQM